MEGFVSALPGFEDVLEDSGLPDWRAALQFLEQEFASAEPEVRTLLVSAFLYYLPFPDQPGHEIVEHLGPTLKAQFSVTRPSG
ncbi:hypothetical protein [Krasilnikovia sp. MM14-A1259]|uniref:hypothetical protein n=1 Tax=Krasilnikovia sp. MM14-A1259 TaxID=3373539 RepID=UPI00399D05A3